MVAWMYRRQAEVFGRDVYRIGIQAEGSDEMSETTTLHKQITWRL